MKKLLGLVLMAVIFLGSAGLANAATRVGGYYKKNGTYVQSYYRSSNNSYKSDNWSYSGNINPHTGKKGYKY